MTSRSLAILKVTIFALAVCLGACAQSTGILRGTVTDPSGAIVQNASVVITGPSGQVVTATSNKSGVFEIKNLAPGRYSMDASAAGFAINTLPVVDILAEKTVLHNIKFDIAVQQEKMNVEESGTGIDVSPSNNAGAIVLKGKDLDALSDDPDELMSDLQALAGPASGPNGGEIYIDGFTNGTLPPKSSIREIRINQNPFSAQFDRLGYGRIEIFTKPGTDKFHGQFQLNAGNSIFNARNPFATTKPGYDLEQYSGNIGGPVSKRASFFFNAERRNINDSAVVNAIILDPSLNQTSFNSVVTTPRTRTAITPRFDVQITPTNTLTSRYQFNTTDAGNNGVGQFNLPSQGYNTSSTENEIQISDTQIIGPKTVNETRFQYERNRDNQFAQTLGPTINVIGAFNGGGSRVGMNTTKIDRYEFQNYTSMNVGNHFVKFGARLRADRQSNDSTSGYNGSFTFQSIQAYRITQQGIQNGLTPAQIRAAGGGASQFTVISGQPVAENTYFDGGLYVEDDWKFRPNLTLSYGLRFETQNNIGDHADFAPRIGISWGLGDAKKAPKTVLRLGYGIFYDRFGQSQVLQALRLNGVNQLQFVVNSPDFFPTLPSASTLAAALTSPTVYRLASNLRAPYNLEAAFTVERQITKSANLTVTYLNTRGVHTLDSRNVNAPLPGTYDPANPASGVFPNGTRQNVYQYESEGVFNQNQLIVNMNVHAGQKVSLFGHYSLNNAHGDSSGAGSFPANQYALNADYGRTLFDVRHRLFFGGSVGLPFSLRVSPFIIASSGQPFNITNGQDLNGDSIFNDRPSFATDVARSSVVVTRWGTFDTAPIAGQTIIPVNYGTGPAQFSVNLRVAKSIGLGPKIESADASDNGGRRGGPGGGHDHGGGIGRGPGAQGMGGIFGAPPVARRYSLTISASGRNLFNRENFAPPVGNLSSPLFGKSNALSSAGFGASTSSNRSVFLQLQFSF